MCYHQQHWQLLQQQLYYTSRRNSTLFTKRDVYLYFSSRVSKSTHMLAQRTECQTHIQNFCKKPLLSSSPPIMFLSNLRIYLLPIPICVVYQAVQYNTIPTTVYIEVKSIHASMCSFCNKCSLAYSMCVVCMCI